MRPVEYLKIEDEGIRPGMKTKRLTVRSRRTSFILGWIQWYGPWRQYAFFPAGGCIFNPDCMMEISDRCKSETSLHRKKKVKSNASRISAPA